jgi:Proteasome subunit
VTVCIGAICDNGKSIVVAADRMMTYGPPMNLQVEAAVRKIIPLSDNAVLLFSGSVPDGEGVANGTKALLQGGKHELRQICEFATLTYQAIKKPSSLMKCRCGETFDSHRLEETLVHVPHIMRGPSYRQA